MLPPVARRFVAGETPAVAFERVREANEDSVGVILNRLGEHYHERRRADADAATYRALLEDIDGSGLDARISVKPSQLGLSVSESTFRENFRSVLDAAADHDVVVWCDMEDATTTDATLDAFADFAPSYPGLVGQCVQANLRRTPDDVERLLDVPGWIRLVKGAYEEPSDVAYREHERVDEALRSLLGRLFEARDSGVAVGSHDPAMVSLAAELHAEYGTDYEVQMLMGVREAAQRDLATEGVDVWQYAPYGTEWPSYFWRRMRERRENLTFALRAVAGR
jgi:proline dehydrogenase